MTLKPVFISLYLTLASTSFFSGGWLAFHDSAYQAWGLPLILVSIPILSWMIWLFVFKPTQLPKRPWWLYTGLPLALLFSSPAGPQAYVLLLICVLIGLVGVILYTEWYAKLKINTIQIKQMPTCPLYSTDGQEISTSNYAEQDVLWVFFRGNWCPICVAQIKQLAKSYQQLADKGINVVMVSPQSQAQSAQIAKDIQAPITFVQDAHNQLARQLNIVDEHGLPMGLQVLGYESAVPMPTVLLTRKNQIVWQHQTDDYRIRPEPEVFLRLIEEAEQSKSTSN